MRRALDVLFGFDAIEREIKAVCEKVNNERRSFEIWFNAACFENNQRREKGLPSNKNLAWCSEYQAQNPLYTFDGYGDPLKRQCAGLVMADRMVAIENTPNLYPRKFKSPRR